MTRLFMRTRRAAIHSRASVRDPTPALERTRSSVFKRRLPGGGFRALFMVTTNRMQNAECRMQNQSRSFFILNSAFCILHSAFIGTIPFVSELDPAVQRHLDTLGLTYQVLDCNPEWADTDLFCANYNIPRQNAANTILVASKSEPKQYSACLVLATTKLDVNHA